MSLPLVRHLIRSFSASVTKVPTKRRGSMSPTGEAKQDASQMTRSARMHPSLVPRRNPFLEPVPAWLRDFRTFQPISIIRASAHVFNAPIRVDIMHRVVHWHRAGLRAGTASTKHRSDVQGSTRKLYRQKGTGRARAGSSRAPHRRGGANCFGPKPRDWSYTLPEKLRNLGLRSALTAKFRQGELSFVSDASISLPKHKTRCLASMLAKVPSRRLLLLHAGDFGNNLKWAAGNLSDRLTMINVRKESVNAYHVLKGHFVVMTESAKEHYETLIKGLPY